MFRSGADHAEHMPVRDANGCCVWSGRSVAELAVVVLTPTPGRAAASDRAAVRQARGDCAKSQVSADGRRSRYAIGRAVSELSVVIASPAKHAAVNRDKAAVHTARDDTDTWCRRR